LVSGQLCGQPLSESAGDLAKAWTVSRSALALACIWLAATCGCSNGNEAEYLRDAPTVTAAAEPAPSAEYAAPARKGIGGGARSRPAKSHRRASGAETGASALLADSATQPAAPPKQKRMVHYNGYLKLRVANPTETLQHATEIADQAGGYVENLFEHSVTLRVPVASFRQVFTSFTKLGNVLKRSLTAQDVTDSFVALDLRGKTLKASRARLIALLAKARKSREKLRLLREIRRLTEEIDQIEMDLTTLASLAEMSRLTVEAVPHELKVESAATEPIAAFRWIHDLSPFRRDYAASGDRLELAVPQGLVELSHRDTWIAEGADGTVIWASQHDNHPHGSTQFWIDALKERLGKEYAQAQVSKVGSFQILRVVDQSERAYRYLVGVAVQGDDLQVVEIYYPSAAQEKRFSAAIQAALEGGAV